MEENVFACHHISINIAGSDWAVWYFCFQYKKIHVSMLNEDEELLWFCLNEPREQWHGNVQKLWGQGWEDNEWCSGGMDSSSGFASGGSSCLSWSLTGILHPHPPAVRCKVGSQAALELIWRLTVFTICVIEKIK